MVFNARACRRADAQPLHVAMASQTYTPRVEPAPKVVPILSVAGKAAGEGGSGRGGGAAGDGAGAGAGGGASPAGLRGDERKPDVFREIRASCAAVCATCGWVATSCMAGSAPGQGCRVVGVGSCAAHAHACAGFLRVCEHAQRCASGSTARRLARPTSS